MMNPYQLYLVTGQYEYSPSRFLKIIEEACQTGVTIIQLREKSLSTRNYFELAMDVKRITDRYHVPLIIDDRVDIMLAVDAAGVHIGDADLPISIVRQLVGPNKLIGVSAKSVSRAIEAEREGADYLGVGAIFPTQTKVITRPTSPETLRDIGETVKIPVVAIGGIKTHNVHTFTGFPIDGVAVVSEIMLSNDIEKTVTALRQVNINMPHI